MKVLQLAFKTPWPARDGGALAIGRMTECMIGTGAEITVLAIQQSKDIDDDSCIPQHVQESITWHKVKVDNRVKLMAAFANLFQKKPYFISRFYSPAFGEALQKLLLQDEYSIIQLEHLSLCQYLPIIRAHSNAPVVLRAHNVEHHIWERYTNQRIPILKKWYLNINVEKLKKYELNALRELDGVMPISSLDASQFQLLAPKLPCLSIPFACDAAPHEKVIGAHEKLKCYHLGSMDWMPNVQSVKWLLEEIWPLVVEKHPHLKLHLSGKKIDQTDWGHIPAGVIIDAEPKDAYQYQMDKEVLLVPLLSGSGVRIKILEAMSMGKVVISTAVGAEGIPYTHGKNLLIADTADQFLACIEHCLHHPEKLEAIGKSARETISHYFSKEEVGHAWKHFCEDLIEKKTD